jgi:hypothetical protein
MTTLTANELKALETCLNYDDRESQLSDNFSNGGAAEFRAVLGWNREQVAALIGSLEKKGMGGMDSEGDDIFWLSEDGVNAVFDHLEAQAEEPAEEPAEKPQATHYFASNALGWATSKVSRDDAVERLVRSQGDIVKRTIKSSQKDGQPGAYCWTCEVLAPQDSTYRIEWFQPKGVDWRYGMHSYVTHLTSKEIGIYHTEESA